MNFGALLKDIRIAKGLTLRQCCEQLGVDPSNWSKLERGITPAPKDPAIVEGWSDALDLKSEARQNFLDTAALSRSELPADIAADEKVLAALPAFFRAARESDLDDAALKQFVEDVRALHSAKPRRGTARTGFGMLLSHSVRNTWHKAATPCRWTSSPSSNSNCGST